MEQKNLSIKLSNQTLVIKGHKQQKQEERDKHYHRNERRYGASERNLASLMTWMSIQSTPRWTKGY
ncbi:MAG: Hsp20/alpha crystallin family protein [Nitrosomonas sp.]|nr:Hsp20/alpha crystallin family protein [Nitrosomonas sp.]